MIALVSTGQLQPGKMNEVLGIVDKFMTLFDSTPGYKRYDFWTLAISLLESQADLDALTATLAHSETYAHVGTLYVPGTVKRGTWEVAIQKTPESGAGKVALVSFAQAQPGTLDELLSKIDKMPLFDTTPGYKRYDFCVNRAENRTLAVSLLGSQADLDAVRASPQLAEAYAQTRPMMVPGSAEQGVWEVAIQRGPK
jgi:hypothetical protein